MYEGPGIYKHYKGGYYRVLGIARHESTGAHMVIYHSYSIDHDLSRWMEQVDFVARPLTVDDGPSPFNSEVTVVGKTEIKPRFEKIK